MKDTINQAVSQQLNNFMKSQEQYINVKMEEIKKSSDTYIVTKTEEYKNYLDKKLEENTESIKNQSKNIITRQTYVLIDVVKSLFPNQKLNESYLQFLVESVHKHTGVLVIMDNVKSYVNSLNNV
jgi:cupin superfamily acireductone dioxygenase involved in methionine salvage